MGKWTPGPWYAYQRKENGRWEIARRPMDEYSPDAHEGRYIADLRGPDWPGVPQGERIDANARLIAAAPEMADELKHICDLLDSAFEQGISIPGLATTNKARALLSRLEGK